MKSSDEKPTESFNKIIVHLIVFSILFICSIIRETGYKAIDTYFSILLAVATFVYFVVLLKKFKWNAKIHRILDFPLTVIANFIPLLGAAFSISFALILTVLVAGGSLLFFISIWEIDLSASAQVYLGITSFAIIATSCFDYFVKFHQYLNNKDYRQFSQDVALFAMNRKKIKYVIFTIYFIALLVLNVTYFTGKPLFLDSKIATAVLQSFATYLAFERLTTNFHLLKAKVS